MPVTYRIDAVVASPPRAPELDVSQRRVVAHSGGPLLVLAGPGTGKTTTLVEAVVDRVERRGLRLDEVLVLTFSRTAALELRDRITARLGRTTATPMSATFHSFCYGLVRRFQPAELYSAPLRLLSAPEHDTMLRELLLPSRNGGLGRWPDWLSGALRTRGFVPELRAVLAKARDLGLDPADLAATGEAAGRPEWVAAASFMQEYLDVLDSSSTLDYTELVHRAVLLCGQDAIRSDVRSTYKAVFVDEYQDTDAAQVRLLQELAGDGRDIVVVGDPDQSIYGFRGADVRGILDFPAQFRRSDGRPADVVALRMTRRCGPVLLRAGRRVAVGIGVRGAIDREVFDQFRAPVPAADGGPDGSVEVLTFSSVGNEAAAIADLARRAHLADGVPWSEIAVLVRSGVTALPLLRRCLVTAGVPVTMAGDEIPLRREPAVAPLLLVLRCAIDRDAVTTEAAQGLLLSALGGLDAQHLRQLGRQLRQRDRREFPNRLPRPSSDLLRQALREPEVLADVPGRVAATVRRLGELIAEASTQLAAGASPEDALWTLWSGTPWPHRLRHAAESGGVAARAAHRDLDAVCSLFDLAGRAEERRAFAGARVFLEEVENSQLPGDARAEQAVRGEGVRLLTAHRAKGLEWQVVVVAGVQEGRWPDLRQRTSLLKAERLISDGALPSASTAGLLAEERRLFYVAVTRARSRLIVTAVDSPEPDGEQPSRFLTALGVPIDHRPGRVSRPLSLAGLVGELRRITADPSESDTLRAAAAARLARLSDAEVAGEPVSPRADPATWWGMRERTHSDVPLRPDDQPLRLTASTLSALSECPLRWFLGREAAGEGSRSSALGFGSVIHVLAEHADKGDSVDPDELIRHLDGIWDQLQFPAPWIASRERAEAHDMLRRFARWHNAPRGRTSVGAEVKFEVPMGTEHGQELQLTGTVDRLERDLQGRAVIVDFKTGKQAPTQKQVAGDVQLGFYQLVTSIGAFAGSCDDVEPGGAELVQLRADRGGMPKVLAQSPLGGERNPGVSDALARAVRVLRHEELIATGHSGCGRCQFARQCPVSGSGGDVLE